MKAIQSHYRDPAVKRIR